METNELPPLPGTLEKLGQKVRDADVIDSQRKNNHAYDYLCRIGEAKEWIEACINEEIPETHVLEEALRNGIILAKLSLFFQPTAVKKIFEDTSRLQYRHSDNINYFFQAMRMEGLPEVFIFELTDLYDKKNMPKVIYCIHALSHFLTKKGKSPRIRNLAGKLTFSEEILNDAAKGLEDVAMPAFGNLQNDLAKELKETPEERLEREKRERLAEITAHLENHLCELVRCQAQAKMHIYRKKFKAQQFSAVKLQSTWKGHVEKKKYNEMLQRFKSNEHLFEKLQAIYKGKKARQDYEKMKQELNEKIPKAVKIQAWWRMVKARNEYKQLRFSQGADVKIIKQYISLFDGQEDEVDEEAMLEKLRASVIQKIRENLAAESELNELDSKVALLVKNRITLDEVARYKSKDMRAALARNAQNNIAGGTILTLRGNDKDTKSKKKLYEELFYLLQTKPVYLASLMYTINQSQGSSGTKFLEQVVLTLFGYAQNHREEYLFLQLIEEAIQIEVRNLRKPDEMAKENPLFVRLVLQYTRGAKEREYLRSLFRPLLPLIMDDMQLDLECDPLAIYKAKIRDEEINTGEKSKRPYDVTAEVAAEDPEVQKTRDENFQKLRSISDRFLSAILKSAIKMPFGIRYIAMKMKDIMSAKFPGAENEKEINVMIGNLLYYRYMNPVIIAPEAFDIIETSVTPNQRKNLAEVAKMIHQISIAREYVAPGKDKFSENITQYVQQASSKFNLFLKEAANTVSSEEYFEMTEFLDVGGSGKLTVFITPDEIVQVHSSLVQYKPELPVLAEDPLTELLNLLGAPPAAGTAAKGPGSEIVLHLSNRFTKINDVSDAASRHLLKDTKRIILCIVRFVTGKSLLDILEEPATPDQETEFAAFVERQETALRNRKAPSAENVTADASPEITSPLSPGQAEQLRLAPPVYKLQDGKILSFAQLKIKALENMAKLEELNLVSKNDHYQSMLDSMVQDMVTKQRRRAKRRKEIQQLGKTMTNLNEKASFLNDATKSYHDYIDACMNQLTNKKSKGKTNKPILFSRQYYHLQNLKKQGGIPQFGSFKYTAKQLFDKGVLISIEEHSPKEYGLINITISSSEAGVFDMEVTFLGAKAAEKETLRLEDLLQLQYDKVDSMMLFEIAKVNVNLLIFLINKKFYA